MPGRANLKYAAALPIMHQLESTPGYVKLIEVAVMGDEIDTSSRMKPSCD